MDELADMTEEQIHAYAAKLRRSQLKAREKARQIALKRREAGLVQKTVRVPAKWANHVAPTIEKMIADLELEEYKRNLGLNESISSI